jgi:glutathione peroxidase-family protein
MTYVSSVYSLKINSLDGFSDLLGEFDNHVCLHVNIATKTGYTPKTKKLWSYARTAKHLYELQQLHDMFSGHGFSVIGYPCGQFGGMENGNNEEILHNIRTTYPFVTFPVTEKIEVNGPNEHAIWSFLKGNQVRAIDDNPADNSELAIAGQNRAGQSVMRIPNNYEKFLTSRDGRCYWRFNWSESAISEKSIVVGSPSVIEIIREIL